MNYKIDIFPIKTANIPKLYAYELTLSTKEHEGITWKVAYKLRKYIQETIWVALPKKNLLIADKKLNDDELKEQVSNLWKEHDNHQDAPFQQIQKIIPHEIHPYQTQAQAAYTRAYIEAHYQDLINKKLKEKYGEKLIINKKLKEKHEEKLKNQRLVTRKNFQLSDYIIHDQPHLAISISSTLYLQDGQLDKYMKKYPQKTIEGLLVRDIHNNNKGTIVKKIGVLKDHRERLLTCASNEKNREKIEKSPDTEPVIQIENKEKDYDYPASCLYIIVENKTAHLLDIEKPPTLTLAPNKRYTIIDTIATILADKGWVEKTRISSQNLPHRFKTPQDIDFKPAYLVGHKQPFTLKKKKEIIEKVKNEGLYAYKKEDKGIKAEVINLLPDSIHIDTSLKKIKKELDAMGCKLFYQDKNPFKLDAKAKSEATKSYEQDLTSAIEKIKANKPAIVLLLIDGKAHTKDFDSQYEHIKKALYAEDIPSQCISGDKIQNFNGAKITDTALGILAKAGHTPWVLAKPLDYADIITGLDVARQAHQKKEGSTNLVATTHFYATQGNFERWIRSDQPIEGEIIPKEVLKTLLPSKYCAHKKILVHRDGRFPKEEIESLQTWGKKINSTFNLVEVIKSNHPRMYDDTGQKKENVAKGTFFEINDKEAILVTTSPTNTKSSARPLYIRTLGQLKLKQALHSVLSMRLLHYGCSYTEPKLPITIEYSDKIGGLALKGIKPKHAEGTVPYWL